MMIVVLYGGDLASDDAARALYWTDEYKRIQADRFFGRVRWADRLRRFGRLLGVGSARILDEAELDTEWTGVGRAGRSMAPIDAIVGAVDPRSGTFGEIPALRRRWKPTWRRLWAVDDQDDLPALPVVRGVDGWYLTGVPRSVVLLKVLRAKGVQEVRIETVSDAMLEAVGDTELRPVDTAYGIVECGDCFDSCCQDESKAV